MSYLYFHKILTRYKVHQPHTSLHGRHVAGCTEYIFIIEKGHSIQYQQWHRWIDSLSFHMWVCTYCEWIWLYSCECHSGKSVMWEVVTRTWHPWRANTVPSTGSDPDEWIIYLCVWQVSYGTLTIPPSSSSYSRFSLPSRWFIGGLWRRWPLLGLDHHTKIWKNVCLFNLKRWKNFWLTLMCVCCDTIQC